MSTPSRVLLVLAAVVHSACYLPPDPPEPDPERHAAETPSASADASRAPRWPDPSLVDGAWRPAAPRESSYPAASLTPRVASALSVGTWSAEVQPPGAEALPDVSLRLRELVLPGDAAGTAEYRFEGYRCRYALYVESVEGNTVRLRQRREEGRCAGAGRITLAWEDGESLVGEWVRPDGRAWFRALLSRASEVSALPDRGNGVGRTGDGEGPERVP